MCWTTLSECMRQNWGPEAECGKCGNHTAGYFKCPNKSMNKENKDSAIVKGVSSKANNKNQGTYAKVVPASSTFSKNAHQKKNQAPMTQKPNSKYFNSVSETAQFQGHNPCSHG